MGRRRKAWLWGGDGRRTDRGRTLPGYYVRYYDYPPGRPRRNRSKNFDSIRAARKWVRIYNARHDLGEIGEVVPIGFGEAVREYLGTLGQRAVNTRLEYAGSLGLLGQIVGDIEVAAIGGAEIDAFMAVRSQAAKEATVAKHVRNVQGFFNWAVDHGYAAANPIKSGTAVPKGQHVRRIKPVSEATLTRIVDACDTEHRKLAVLIAITTTLDRGVIAKLTPEHVDVDHRCLVVMRPKTARRTNLQIVVPVHVNLWPRLRAVLAQTPPMRPLFQGLSRQGPGRDWWKRAVAAAGVPDLRFADLRKLASSRLQTVMPLTAVRDLGGWASTAIVAQHYSPPTPDVVQRIDSLPLPGSPGHPPAPKTD